MKEGQGLLARLSAGTQVHGWEQYRAEWGEAGRGEERCYPSPFHSACLEVRHHPQPLALPPTLRPRTPLCGPAGTAAHAW